MVMERDFHSETTKLQYLHYKRHIKVITAVWAIFTICFVILNAVAFLQAQWLGDTDKSPGVGFFGLYESCERLQIGGEYSCIGDFLDFSSISNDYFKVASILVGICNLLFIFAAFGTLLFFFIKAVTVLRVCGWLELLGGVCLAVACIVYPAAWDDDNVRKICGGGAKSFDPDRCQIRWAYVLAIVLIFDAFILAGLAFYLAARQVSLSPRSKYEKFESTKSPEINGGFSSRISFTEEKPPIETSFIEATPTTPQEPQLEIQVQTATLEESSSNSSVEAPPIAESHDENEPIISQVEDKESDASSSHDIQL